MQAHNYEEGLGSLELWNTPLETTDPEDIEEGFLGRAVPVTEG